MTDFVGINKDFQRFVSFVAQTVDEQLDSPSNSFAISDVMKFKPSREILQNQPNSFATVEEALGDIVASIR